MYFDLITAVQPKPSQAFQALVSCGLCWTKVYLNRSLFLKLWVWIRMYKFMKTEDEINKSCARLIRACVTCHPACSNYKHNLQ